MFLVEGPTAGPRLCPPYGLLLRALAQRRQAVGAHGATFSGTIAHLGRVVGCILLAAQRLARELDEMVRDEAHAEHRVDLSAAHCVARRPPERFAVVGENSDMPD